MFSIKNNIFKFSLFFLTFVNVYAYEISVKDEFNLIGEKKIEFETKEELIDKIEKLTLKMLENGYVTSKIVNDGESLKVIPGRINKIILEDDSTSLLELKRELLGLNSLEKKLLNVKDIEKIVEKYKKDEFNNINIKIDNIEGTQDSNVIIHNEHKFKIDTKLTLKYSEKFNYDLNFNFNKVLGLNDKLELNLNFLKNKSNVNVMYMLPIKNSELIVKYDYSKIRINEDVTEKENEFSINLKSNINNIIFNNSFTLYNKIPNIRETKIRSDYYYDFETNMQYLKLVKVNDYYFQFLLSPKLMFSIINMNDYKSGASLDFNIYSKYYDLSSKLLLNEEGSYNRYKKALNPNGFYSIPLNMGETNKLMYINNKIKYPIIINDLKITPFMELAIGTNFKKISKGLSIGTSLEYKNFDFNVKYSLTDDKKSFSLNTSIKF